MNEGNFHFLPGIFSKRITDFFQMNQYDFFFQLRLKGETAGVIKSSGVEKNVDLKLSASLVSITRKIGPHYRSSVVLEFHWHVSLLKFKRFRVRAFLSLAFWFKLYYHIPGVMTFSVNCGNAGTSSRILWFITCKKASCFNICAR